LTQSKAEPVVFALEGTMARPLRGDDPMALRLRAAAARKLSEEASDAFVRAKLLNLEMALLAVAWLSDMTRASEDLRPAPWPHPTVAPAPPVG
jgi:hypothetical protein